MSSVRSDDLVTEKYVVYRGDDAAPLPPRSFFVLRSSDMFGAAALYAYAGLIGTQLEFARSRPGVLTDAELMALESLEAYVVGLAQEWQREGQGRIPD